MMGEDVDVVSQLVKDLDLKAFHNRIHPPQQVRRGIAARQRS